MLAIYEPEINNCSFCCEQTTRNNVLGLCEDCYKTAFAIEEVLVKQKVDWSKLGSKSVRPNLIKQEVWEAPEPEKVKDLPKKGKKKKKENPDHGRMW